MADPELTLVDELIKERTVAERFYLVCACALVLVAFFSLVSAVFRSGAPFDRMAGTVTGIFGAIPVVVCFTIREQRIYYRYLKTSWENARAENDQQTIKTLRIEIKGLRKNVLDKPWWAIKR